LLLWPQKPGPKHLLPNLWHAWAKIPRAFYHPCFWIYGVFAWKEAFQNSVSVQLVTAIALIGTLLALATLLQSRMSLPSPNRQTAVPKRLS